MKVIDAFWEQRNLGVNAVSFYIEEKDSLDDVLINIDDNPREYQTAIVNPIRSDVLLELQNHGFKFIECSLSLAASIDRIHIPDNVKRFQNQMA